MWQLTYLDQMMMTIAVVAMMIITMTVRVVQAPMSKESNHQTLVTAVMMPTVPTTLTRVVVLSSRAM